jgi:hypothetical protein
MPTNPSTFMRRLGRQALAASAILTLAGCANQPKALYHWGSYQPQVYAYLQAQDHSDPQEQISRLEEDLQQARSANQAPPPGYHAHLGLLYAKIGKDDQVRQEFETEKTLFPESATFMDFLARSYAK